MKDRIGFVNERDYLLKKGIIKLLMVKDSDIRIMTLEQCRDAVDKSVHAGGAFSCIIPLVSLYYGEIMDIDVENPTRIGQDMFILSKGHAIAALASVCRSGVLWQGYSEEFQVNRLYTKRPPGTLAAGNSRVNRPAWAGLSASTGLSIAGKRYPVLTCIVYLETEDPGRYNLGSGHVCRI